MVKRKNLVTSTVVRTNHYSQKKAKGVFSVEQMKRGRVIFDALKKEKNGARLVENIDIVTREIAKKANIPSIRAHAIAQKIVYFEMMKKIQERKEAKKK